eukprot:PhF_6_TR19684/c0_g1_i1/m.28737
MNNPDTTSSSRSEASEDVIEGILIDFETIDNESMFPPVAVRIVDPKHSRRPVGGDTLEDSTIYETVKEAVSGPSSPVTTKKVLLPDDDVASPSPRKPLPGPTFVLDENDDRKGKIKKNASDSIVVSAVGAEEAENENTTSVADKGQVAMVIVSVLCGLAFVFGVVAIGYPNWATLDGNAEGVGLVDTSDPVCAAEEVINVVFSMSFLGLLAAFIASFWGFISYKFSMCRMITTILTILHVSLMFSFYSIAVVVYAWNISGFSPNPLDIGTANDSLVVSWDMYAPTRANSTVIKTIQVNTTIGNVTNTTTTTSTVSCVLSDAYYVMLTADAFGLLSFIVICAWPATR